MSKVLRVGVAGLGTVGRGVVKVLEANGDLIAARAGRRIEVVAVSARSQAADRGIDLGKYRWYDNAVDMAAADDIDVVVELIGGAEGIARQIAETALKGGKALVTANKALIAHHGMELATLAEANKLPLRLDAAVAGGIPIIKAISDGLAANRCRAVFGILNGTCNYILTEMERSGRPFADILADAQRMGYAEADPSFDVDGVDTAHKLSILSAVAFGTVLSFGTVGIQGIRNVTPIDISHAAEFGYRIKLLGIARYTGDGLEQRVAPCLVRKSNPLAAVNDVFNAVVVEGDYVGRTVYEGRGAGEGPTASAVVADLVDVARGNRAPVFSIPAKNLNPAAVLPSSALKAPFYVHARVVDEPGVIAAMTEALRDEGISIENLMQRGEQADGGIHVIFTTHDTPEDRLQAAVARIASLRTVLSPPTVMRMIRN